MENTKSESLKGQNIFAVVCRIKSLNELFQTQPLINPLRCLILNQNQINKSVLNNTKKMLTACSCILFRGGRRRKIREDSLYRRTSFEILHIVFTHEFTCQKIWPISDNVEIDPGAWPNTWQSKGQTLKNYVGKCFSSESNTKNIKCRFLSEQFHRLLPKPPRTFLPLAPESVRVALRWTGACGRNSLHIFSHR